MRTAHSWKSRIVVFAAWLAIGGCGEHRATEILPAEIANKSSSEPSLVECPSNQTVRTSAIVGLLGGVVRLGATTVRIPSGALTLPTLITITVPESRFMEIDVQANDLTSFLFQKPVDVTIDYSRCSRSDINSEVLTVWHINPQTHELLQNMGGSDDKVNRRITFTTDHLSGYAIAF